VSKVRPPYPAEFRQQVVELVRAGALTCAALVWVRRHRAVHHPLGRPGRHRRRQTCATSSVFAPTGSTPGANVARLSAASPVWW